MQTELADAKHELLKIQEMLEMTEKVISTRCTAVLLLWEEEWSSGHY